MVKENFRTMCGCSVMKMFGYGVISAVPVAILGASLFVPGVGLGWTVAIAIAIAAVISLSLHFAGMNISREYWEMCMATWLSGAMVCLLLTLAQAIAFVKGYLLELSAGWLFAGMSYAGIRALREEDTLSAIAKWMLGCGVALLATLAIGCSLDVAALLITLPEVLGDVCGIVAAAAMLGMLIGVILMMFSALSEANFPQRVFLWCGIGFMSATVAGLGGHMITNIFGFNLSENFLAVDRNIATASIIIAAGYGVLWMLVKALRKLFR